MDPKPHWEDVHAESAEDDVSWFLPHPERALRFLDELGVPPDTSVIDVGCGASGLAEHVLARGHRRVFALDVSAAALRRARERLGPQRAAAVTWIEADATRLDVPERFDVWHDRAVFHFLVEADARRQYVDALTRHVGEGGLVLLATFALDGPETCSGLPVARYDADGLAREIGGAFRLVARDRDVHTTPWGTTQPFTWAAFRKD